MKVLIIGQLPKEVGGNYTTGAANVVYELSKRKVESVTFYTYGTNISYAKAEELSSYKYQYLGYKFFLCDILKDVLLHPLTCIKEWRHYKNIDHVNPLRFELYKVNIRRAIDLVSPDLIHVHSIGNVSPVRYALGKHKTPVLLTCHGIFYRGNSSDVIQRDRHLGNIQLADYYSGLTNESLDEYEQILGVSRFKVAVIPNGVDCKKFYFDQTSRNELRSKLGVSEETKVFITVASVQQRKGQFEFVKLLEKLPVDCQYWIIGEGADVKTIQEYIEQKKMNNIKLLGYHSADELNNYYSAADIYAHVSTKEGQALCEIEANATGLRTIVNKAIVGTIPNIVAGDYYILDYDNPELSRGLIGWIYKENRIRKSNQSMDWQVIAEMYAKLYYQIVNERHNWKVTESHKKA